MAWRHGRVLVPPPPVRDCGARRQWPRRRQHRAVLSSVPRCASVALVLAHMCATQAPETAGRKLKNSFLPQLTATAGQAARRHAEDPRLEPVRWRWRRLTASLPRAPPPNPPVASAGVISTGNASVDAALQVLRMRAVRLWRLDDSPFASDSLACLPRAPVQPNVRIPRADL